MKYEGKKKGGGGVFKGVFEKIYTRPNKETKRFLDKL